MISSSKKPIVSINLTPLVDVSLVLVVIFMATAPMFMQSGMAVTPGEKKSDSSGAASAGAADTLFVKLLGTGLYLDDRKIELTGLAAELSRAVQAGKKRVVIMPGGEVLHGDVIQVMDIAKQAGAKKLVIMGPPPNPEKK